MGSLSRSHILFDGDSFHVTWQCHNHDWLLHAQWAKAYYYHLLLTYKEKYGVRIYSYNFMDNHPHLSGQLSSRERFSNFFKLVNSLFAKEVNRQMKRRGQVVMDRFKSPRIQDDPHLLAVMIYIDLNQVRVGKIKRPEKGRFSSYHYYAHGQDDPLITPAPSYLALANTDRERQLSYREMVYAVMEAKGYVNISHTHFIGDPDWVKEQYEGLKVILESKRRVKKSPSTPDDS